MYFNVFTQDEHGFTFLDFVSDAKFWMLFIYISLLIFVGYLSFWEYRLIKIWCDCNRVFDENMDLNVINKRNIEIYHNHIHENKMKYDMLTTFFGELSDLIMEYVGMIGNDKLLYIPSLSECLAINERICHKNTISLNNSQYLFAMNSV